MRNKLVLIITTLVDAWSDGNDTFGPSMIRWVIEVDINDIMGDFGYADNLIFDELVKRQPQLEKSKMLGWEEADLCLA